VDNGLRNRLQAALAELEGRADGSGGAGLKHYGITTADRVIGVPMKAVQAVAKLHRKDHALAQALWDTPVYEAKLLACYVGDPAQVTPAQMDHWSRGFDNWATCDTACFALFDRSPYAWDAIDRWAGRNDEFGRRGAFALLASVALHDKKGADAPFEQRLALIARAATDDRNFVKKAVNWALRAIWNRKSAVLKAAAVALAEKLAASDVSSARWIGKDALRQIRTRTDKN
jgi:3-methyladenine DNA glycosylase AlkD